MDDGSPTARALLTLELIQGSPGVTAYRLADKLNKETLLNVTAP